MAKKRKSPANQISAADLENMGPAARAQVEAQMKVAEAQQEAAAAIEEAAEHIKSSAKTIETKAKDKEPEKKQSYREYLRETSLDNFEKTFPGLSKFLSVQFGIDRKSTRLNSSH